MNSSTRGRLLAVAALVAVMTAGWWFKAHCVTDGGWEGGEQYALGCYTDLHALWGLRDLDQGAVPYLEVDVEYPVLVGAQMLAAERAAHALTGPGADSQIFLALTAAANGLLLAVAAWWVVRLVGVRGPAWWAAAAVPTVLYVAHNWDALAIAAMMTALGLHVRGRDGWAGAAAGIGVAAKLFPGLLIPVVVAARFAQRRPRAALVHAGAAAAAWLVVNLPVAVVAPAAWWRFYAFSSDRPPTFASVWGVVTRVLDLPAVSATRDLAALGIFLAGAALIAWVGRRCEPARWWALTAPLLTWFVLTNKVHSPQFDLWLVPLLLVVLPRLAPLVAFVASDLLVYWLEFSHLALRAFDQGIGEPWLSLAVAARSAVLVWIVVITTRSSGPAPAAADPDPGAARSQPPATAAASRSPAEPGESVEGPTS